jgi:tRNA (pseudouridine54-N1)-methyltransferase
MREFVVVGHDAPTDDGFSLDDLPGAGRADLLVRTVGAGLFTSHGIREDSRVHLVCQNEVTVTFDGSTLRNARPDERSLGGLLRTALGAVDEAIGHQPAEPAPGLSIRKRGLEATLEEIARNGTVIALHEDGEPLSAVERPPNPVFVLSDHRDFTEEESTLMASVADSMVSVGPTVIHADHTTAVVQNWLDTDGYTRY